MILVKRQLDSRCETPYRVGTCGSTPAKTRRYAPIRRHIFVCCPNCQGAQCNTESTDTVQGVALLGDAVYL